MSPAESSRRSARALLRAAALVTALGASGAALGCRGCAGTPSGADATAPAPSTAVTAAGGGEPKVVLDWIRRFDDCALGHRGTLLDLGDPTMRARYGPRLATPVVDSFERDGSTWVRLRSRSISLSLVTAEPLLAESGLAISARARGGAARAISVSLDGRPMGHLTLTHNEAKVSELRSPQAALEAGAHQLDLRFVGGGKASPDTLGELDWVRLGEYDGDAAYAAPTRRDALVSTPVGGRSERALSLRGEAFARCTAYIPSDAVFRADLALTGGGEADVELRVLRDRKDPRVVAQLHLGAAEAAAWRPVAIPLGEVDTTGAVELRVVRARKGTRVLFGEARVVRTSPAAPRTPFAPARGVVLVVLGTMAPRSLSAFGGERATPELARLAEHGLVFDQNRATSALSNAVVASMLSGGSPTEHGLVDGDARLVTGPTLVSEAARQAGIATAFFTANPTTSAVFGFDRGWEVFVAKAPVGDGQATAVFDEAIRFLETHKTGRFFVTIHARGGHPPWDASDEQMKDLPPQNYTGGLDPKHAGELLAKAKRVPPVIRYTDGDRERAAALHTLAVQAHDAALGRLLSALRLNGQDESTTVIVTGDVAADEGAHVPFAESDALDEGTLATFLVVRPHRALPLKPGRVSAPSESMHVASTVLDAFGLRAPRTYRWPSLFELAESHDRADSTPRVAVASQRFSARFGDFVLSGAGERETRLCDLALEPACTTDVRATHPLATETLHRRLFDELATGKQVPREDARLDPPAAAALKVWGR